MVTRMFEEEFVVNGSQIAEGQNVIKASLFNLIVVANTPQAIVHCQELVRIVTEKYPCRIIFVQVDESGQTDIFRTERSVEIVGSGQTRVCFDQLSIETSLRQLHKVPFLVLPNIMPDLPIYLLLGHDPTQDQVILPQLQKYAARVIFDAESITNPQRFSDKIQTLLHDAHSDFIDVNWAHTKAWRELMPRVFDDAKKLETLSKAKSIQISYSSPTLQQQSTMDLQAIYFQAWLAARLGWTLLTVEKETGALRLSYRSDHSPISITLIPKDSEALEAGAIFSVEILTHNDSHFLISHENTSSTVTVHASNTERCEIPYNVYLSNYQRGTALVHEIFYQPQSEHYLHMLQALNHPEWAKL